MTKISAGNAVNLISGSISRGLPECYQKRATSICELLAKGESYRKHGGKKLQRCPDYVRFKLGYHYRLLCKFSSSGLIPQQILSHEAYNGFLNRV